jgi:hypothetical protein
MFKFNYVAADSIRFIDCFLNERINESKKANNPVNQEHFKNLLINFNEILSEIKNFNYDNLPFGDAFIAKEISIALENNEYNLRKNNS